MGGHNTIVSGQNIIFLQILKLKSEHRLLRESRVNFDSIRSYEKVF